ncbi:hypothetical protein EKK58_09560 [Candidatus Dependentiae bacterium]|nr:MAG: hypothetical protein EKK58_09560 [Candidatus Dependentiae bacterium]
MEVGSLGQGLAGGYLNRLPPNATREEQIAAINDIINRLNSMLKTQAYSDGNSKRFLMGYQASGWPGGDFGMKISQPGVDVTTAENNQLLFSWDFTTNTQIFYNAGIPRIIQGAAPTDGRTGQWISEVGVDVTTVVG